MKLSLLPLALLAAQSCLQATQAYLIDEDTCTGDDRTLMKASIEDAFAMAEEAYQELDASEPKREVVELIKKLFGVDTIAEISHAKGDAWVYKDLWNIARENSGTAYPEVRFFCRNSRYEKRSDNKWYHRIFQTVSREDLEDCYQLSKDRVPTLMFTYARDPLASTPDETDICPWFLNYVRKKDTFIFSKSGLMTGVAKVAIWMVEHTGWRYTKVDATALFSKVILHEMTHTRTGGLSKDQGGYDGYGWKNCRSKADAIRAGTARKGNTDEDPQWNADSLALFASGVRLIRQGTVITPEGDLSPIRQAFRMIRRGVEQVAKSWTA